MLAHDVGAGVGLGHLRRMQALAASLRTRGVSSELVDSAAGARAPVVVVDSYRQRGDDRTRFEGDVVVVVEDLERDQQVDIAIDSCPGADPGRHGEAGLVLAGPAYALVDPTLATMSRRPVGPEVQRILVTGGGADAAGWGIGVAQALRAHLPHSIVIALVRGPGSADTPLDGIESISTIDGLGPALASADLVVTAAGVTMLEALALGRPTVAAALFANQVRQARATQAAGAIILARPHDAADAAAVLSHDAHGRVALAARAIELLDGHGAGRVAGAICERR